MASSTSSRSIGESDDAGTSSDRNEDRSSSCLVRSLMLSTSIEESTSSGGVENPSSSLSSKSSSEYESSLSSSSSSLSLSSPC